MKVLLVSAFSNISSLSNNRLLSIFIHIKGSKIVVTTDFNHASKVRYESHEISNPDQVNIHVPSYKKNICLRRIWSHMVFAKRLQDYLNSIKDKPETIYCTMPTSSSAFVCARFCKKHNIKFVIDVIDLWPDSLLPLVKYEKILSLLLSPWKYITTYAYNKADVIIGESVKYACEAQRYNNKATCYPIYLGIDTKYIDKVKAHNPINIIKPNDEIWIGYAGSLGNSYDFDTLLKAIEEIDIRNEHKYKFWFIGDGVRRAYIESYINEKNLNAEITGFLSYDKLLAYLSYCDIAINIFMPQTKVVYSYKFNDYVAMDCFVLNSLEGETAQMIDEYKIGLNFNFSDNPLYEVLNSTIANWETYSKWRKNTQKLISEKLDKEKIYSVVTEIFA